MTCIAGFTDGTRTVIGGDSAGVSGFDLMVRADQKVFRVGGFVFGFTSSFRMGQLLRYRFSPPTLKRGRDIYEYMVTDFIDSVRACFKDGGFASTDSSGSEKGGTFLVGYQGRLFTVESDYQVGENTYPFAAVGCGDNLALGAFMALTTARPDYEPEQYVEEALKVSEALNGGVSAPFHLECTVRGKLGG